MKNLLTTAGIFTLCISLLSCKVHKSLSESHSKAKKESANPHITINTPDEALAELKSGNIRFIEGKMINTDYKEEIQETKDGQHPHSIILSCIDSRVPPEIIFDQGIGHIFDARVAGNIIDPNELGSLEFATAAKKSKLIVVLGHSNCGAIEGAVNDVHLGNLTQLLSQIKPAIVGDSTNRPMMLEKTTKKNVEITIDHILSQSPIISDLVKAGKVKIVGAYYDVSTGKVSFL